MKHTCHARDCKTVVPPRMFMCQRHWYMVPEKDRKRLWDLYTPGQEVTKDPSMDYLDHAMKCIEHVATLEARVKAERALATGVSIVHEAEREERRSDLESQSEMERAHYDNEMH